MPSIGFAEIAVIFVLLLVVVGPEKLPQVARTMFRAVGEARRVTDDLKSNLMIEGADLSPRRPAGQKRRFVTRPSRTRGEATPDIVSPARSVEQPGADE
jgi:sec-independent protein translocase protein TatB